MALVILIIDTQPSRAGLTFGSGPLDLDEWEQSATLLFCYDTDSFWTGFGTHR
jgi:hypothetical protein